MRGHADIQNDTDAILYGISLRGFTDPIDRLDPTDLWISGAYFEDYKGWSGTAGWIANKQKLPDSWTLAVGADAAQLLPGQLMTERIRAIDEGEYGMEHVVGCEIDRDPGHDKIEVTALDDLDIHGMAVARYSRESFLLAVEAVIGSDGIWRYHPGAMALCYMVPVPTTPEWCKGVVFCRHTSYDRSHDPQALKQHLLS